MTLEKAYRIGTPGIKWREEEKTSWAVRQTIKRSYQEQVVEQLRALKTKFDVEQYGELSYDAQRYPLFVVKSRHWDANKHTVLITGGVHGYETSGVQGAIRFLQEQAKNYSDQFNLVVAPCVSPWAYETINRWNPHAVDPNRSFFPDSPAEEAEALMLYVSALNAKILVHFDLHETTDTDNSEFRPALAARDAVEHDHWDIPDGFYLVADTENYVDDFQKSIIESVEKVTHIAQEDENGKIIGVTPSQRGVINYATQALGLCSGFSHAMYCTTTEVYPDSERINDEICIVAQVAAITGGLDYIKHTL